MKNQLVHITLFIATFYWSVAGAQDETLELSEILQNEETLAEEGEREESEERQDIREIVVTPLLDRGDLRKLHNEVEESFFTKFNELNIDDEYDILCYRIKPAMSHISRRVCEPNFIYAARAENASEVMFFLGNPGAIPPPLISEQELVQSARRKYEELQRRMEALMESDAEFKEIGDTLGEIKYRIETYGDDN